MIRFIDDHRAAYGVEPICKVLPIAPSTYFDHAAKRENPEIRSDRAKRDEAYRLISAGSMPRISKFTGRERSGGSRGGRARCCPLYSGAADAEPWPTRRCPRQPVKTTISDKATPCPLDRVNRQFQVPAPNRLWVSDFTYVTTGQSFVYVA